MNIKIATSFLILISLSFISCLGPFPQTTQHPVKPRTSSTANKFVPTNSWYQNWLVGTGENPIHTYPYILKASQTGLTICYASQMVNQNAYILEVFNANLVLSVREAFGAPAIDVSTVNQDAWDLGVKLNFGTAFDVQAARGAASLLVRIHSATPVFKTIHAIIGQSNIAQKNFKVSFNNGQTWLIQSEKAILWTTNADQIYAPGPYDGWIKISIVPSQQAEQALLLNTDSLISNGHVSYTVDRSTSPGEITVKVNYNAQGLYYILPHAKNPIGSNHVNGASTKGIKGTYIMSSGTGYSYKMPIFESDFKASSITSSQDKKNKLIEALKNDVNLAILSKDPYFGGKELARTANLIEIADLVGDSVNKQKARNVLVNELDNYWFGVSNQSPALVYEPTWGGLVSKESVGSAEADFGIYYYNDHHFHYGYFINAAATLAKHYPDYYNSRVEYFNIILADFAGTCIYKEMPCRARNKDAFMGHSFASGLFEFADSRNQESTSEAINAYWGVRELGKNTNNKTLQDLGDYLLSSEIVATKVYWQIKNPSSIYEQPYAKNGVVGILWETKVDYATWFGANVEFIYGIQMLPFTPITTQHLDKDWLRETRSIWSAPINNAATEEGWKGFLLLADAIVEPNRAGISSQIHSLNDYDNGNTRTNTLYFYYSVGGTVPGGQPEVTTQSGGSTATSTAPTGSTTGSLNTDYGKPDPGCSPTQLGCHTTSGSLVGCYEQSNAQCFYGGSICPKPLKACVNPSSPAPGAACYDQALYNCVNGSLVFIG